MRFEWDPSIGGEPDPRQVATFDEFPVAGKKVRLEFDMQQRDRHGRILAYVYLEDGAFVNAWPVEQGYAQVITVPPNVKYQELFLEAPVGGEGDHDEGGARESTLSLAAPECGRRNRGKARRSPA